MNTIKNIFITAEEGVLLYSPFTLREYTTLLTSMLSSLQSSLSLELNLVRDATMILYNRDYMGCSGPTNVLSFEGFVDAGNVFFENEEIENIPTILPSLILSLETADREACLYSQKKEKHICFLLAHGLVHLHGYDHGDEMDELVRLCLENCI